MTKKDLLTKLNNGVVRCIIDGAMKQYTRNPELTGLNEDLHNVKVTAKTIKSSDKGSSIGVFDIGEGKFMTIQNANIESFISS